MTISVIISKVNKIICILISTIIQLMISINIMIYILSFVKLKLLFMRFNSLS